MKPQEAIKRSVLKIVPVDSHNTVETLSEELPKSWTIFGDTALLPENCLISDFWEPFRALILDSIAEVLHVRRIGRNKRVRSDGFRSPNIEILIGDLEDSWVTHLENKIVFTWDVTKSMFCKGNISERIRVSEWNMADKTVVDLFAGIGYFTLPMLVHGRAKHVYACDWNPVSLKALERACALNRVDPGRVTVILGDSSKLTIPAVADHVHLGLIPSSEVGWLAAVRVLNPVMGGTLCVHGTIDRKSGREGEMEKWMENVRERFQGLLETERRGCPWQVRILGSHKVKSYGPRVDHVIVDLHCQPKEKD